MMRRALCLIVALLAALPALAGGILNLMLASGPPDTRADKFFNITVGLFSSGTSAAGYSDGTLTGGTAFGSFVGSAAYGSSTIVGVYSAVAATPGSSLVVYVTGHRPQNWFYSIDVQQGTNPDTFFTASADRYSYDSMTDTTGWEWDGARAWTSADNGLNRDVFIDAFP